MANLRKEGAKKIRIENGHVYTGTGYNSEAEELTYALTVTEPWKQEGKRAGYVAELTEEEMLRTVAKWLETHHDNVAQRARKAKHEAARAKGREDAANG